MQQVLVMSSFSAFPANGCIAIVTLHWDRWEIARWAMSVFSFILFILAALVGRADPLAARNRCGSIFAAEIHCSNLAWNMFGCREHFCWSIQLIYYYIFIIELDLFWPNPFPWKCLCRNCSEAVKGLKVVGAKVLQQHEGLSFCRKSCSACKKATIHVIIIIHHHRSKGTFLWITSGR